MNCNVGPIELITPLIDEQSSVAAQIEDCRRENPEIDHCLKTANLSEDDFTRAATLLTELSSQRSTDLTNN